MDVVTSVKAAAAIYILNNAPASAFMNCQHLPNLDMQ